MKWDILKQNWNKKSNFSRNKVSSKNIILNFSYFRIGSCIDQLKKIEQLISYSPYYLINYNTSKAIKRF